MIVEVVRARDLSQADRDCWSRMQKSDSTPTSPFFRPEFAVAVEAVRDDLHVGVIQNGEGAPKGFFPFHRRKHGAGVPVAFPFSDYHGLIAAPGFQCDPRALVRACGLTVWDFGCVPASQDMFRPFYSEVESSPVIHLPGYTLRNAEERKARKLAREVGQLRFEPRVTDPESLETLIEWKRSQCRRTGFYDLFQDQWARDLVRVLQSVETPDFAGLLSVLYAGERMVAAHMGLRSDHVWHWWYPTYDPGFSKYSPGLLLLIEMIKRAPSMGLTEIDFGVGEQAFKRRFSNRSIPVGRGYVAATLLRSVQRRLGSLPHRMLRDTPLERPARFVYRTLRDRTFRRKS